MKVLQNRRAPTSYGEVVAQSVDRHIGISAASVSDSPFADRHLTALRSLRDLLRSLSGDDSRILTLHTAHNRGGAGNSDTWEPGEGAQVLFASAGLTGDLDQDLPGGGDLLNELIAVSVTDAFDQLAEIQNRQPAEAVAAESAAIREAHDRAERIEEQNAALTAALNSKESEVADLEAQLANLKRLAQVIKERPIKDEPNGAKPKAKTTTRRVKRINPEPAPTKTGDNR